MKTIVIKLGGEIVQSPELDLVAEDVRALVEAGHRVTLVHGGGPQASALQKRLGLEPRMIAGQRQTDAATLEVMKFVVAGQARRQARGLSFRLSPSPSRLFRWIVGR